MVCLTFGTFSHGLLSRCGDRQCMIKMPTLLRLVNLVLLLPISGKIHFFIWYIMVWYKFLWYIIMVWYTLISVPPLPHPPLLSTDQHLLSLFLSPPTNLLGMVYYGTKESYKRLQKGTKWYPLSLPPICSRYVPPRPFSFHHFLKPQSFQPDRIKIEVEMSDMW